MNKKQIGIILLVFGIVFFIISQTVKFTKEVRYNDMLFGNYTTQVENTSVKNTVMFLGLALLVIGGIVLALGFGEKTENTCTNCGKHYNPETSGNFCVNCGSKLIT